MKPIPKAPGPGGLSGLLRDGYRFGCNRFDQLGSDIFKTRLIIRPAVCVRGEDAARMFYEDQEFTRRGALPPTTLVLLQDYRSVNRMVGEAHRHRKRMFMDLMTEDGIRQLCELAKEEWISTLEQKGHGEKIILHQELTVILCKAALRWVGIDCSATEARRWAKEFAAMIDGAGSVGWRFWRALYLRSQTESRTRSMIREVRDKVGFPKRKFPPSKPSLFRDSDEELLPVRTAAVELINVLRPIVAVSRYITFAALALHHYPDCRRRVTDGSEIYLDHFVNEVRRYYPFFPMVAGRAKKAFDWKGHRIAKGTLVLLDLYATNHDARLWDNPNRFDPTRFTTWEQGRFNFIPQGGGDYHRGHRCPGEAITLSLMRMAVKRLCTSVNYEVPQQDLRIPYNRFPTLPKSGFIIRKL